MKPNTRRTRFENRVGLEREFLTQINQKFGKTAPLAGMTRDAIDAWQTRAQKARGGEAVELIHNLLIEVSTRAELIADHSRDVFDRDGHSTASSLDDLRVLLAKTISAV